MPRMTAADLSKPTLPASTDVKVTLRNDYWNDYYGSGPSSARLVPSQFAAFVAGEMASPHRVVEFGCGNGRDAIFFASFGHEVIGVDASEAAVRASRQRAGTLGERVTIIRSDIGDNGLAEQLEVGTGPLMVYARFFIHAITDEEELGLLDLVADITEPGDRLAVEYRTVRDTSGPKATGTHYRRFVTPSTFQANTLARGFDVAYAVEGFGFAKYKQDDAYVARTIFVRR
jgi:SAM-dependent methyltransferase